MDVMRKFQRIKSFCIGGLDVFLAALFLSLLASHDLGDTFRLSDVMLVFPFAFAGALFAFITPPLFLYASKKVDRSAFRIFAFITFGILIGLVAIEFPMVFFDDGLPRMLSLALILFVILPFSILFLFGKTKPQILLSAIAGIETLLILLLIPWLRYTPGNVSFGDYIACHPYRTIDEKISPDFAYRKTTQTVCMPRNFCRKFQPSISCNDPNRLWDGYVPITNVRPEDFQANRYEDISGKKLEYWIIDVGNTAYFWSAEKGDGRFFSVDKNSLEYLGHDLFRDKSGFIYKNTRLRESEVPPEKIESILHPLEKNL